MNKFDETTEDVVTAGVQGTHRSSARVRTAGAVSALLVLAGAVAAACGTGPAAAPKPAHPGRTTAQASSDKASGKPQKAVLAITPIGKKATKPAAKPVVRPAQKPPAKPEPALTGDILSATALGPIQFGMTVSQAEAAAGVTISQHYYSGPECQLGQSTSLPGVVFNVDPQTDVILAVQVTSASAGIETLAGIGLGDNLPQVKATYGGSLKVLSDIYNGNGTTDVDTGQAGAYSLESGQPGLAPSVVFIMSYAKSAGAVQTVDGLVAGNYADGMSFC